MDQDTITLGSGDNVVVGDNGVAEYVLATQQLDFVETIDRGEGGSDTITATGGVSVILGGAAGDVIDYGVGDGMVVGDDGKVTYTNGILTRIESIETAGGDDQITGGAQMNRVIGGVGNDTIKLGAGDNAVIGDNGQILFTTIGQFALIETLDYQVGGRDSVITTGGENIVLGGADGDNIEIGPGRSTVIGDESRVTYDNGVMRRAETLEIVGGDDTITIASGTQLVIGGDDRDSITTGAGHSVVLGDNGFFDFDPAGKLTEASTRDHGIGENDTIVFGAGTNVILGGDADDLLQASTDQSIDYVLGDNGFATFNPDKLIIEFITTNPLIGGNDRIETRGMDDIVFGGTGNDYIHGGDGYDVLMGDHAQHLWNFPANEKARSIFTTDAEGAGNDQIYGGGGDDQILGQQGNDLLVGGAGEDDLIGGHNVRRGDDGDDVMIGDDGVVQLQASAFGDQLYVLLDEGQAATDGTEGADVMLGDNGQILRRLRSLDNLPVDRWVRYPAPFADVIRDVYRFDDIDIIVGDDVQFGQGGEDILHGQRGNDVIDGGDQDDEIFGELGNDRLSGGAGNDIMLADAGIVTRAYQMDATPQINANGSWHRDVLLEEVGVITESISISNTLLSSSTSDLADRMMSAERIVLTGSFDDVGNKQQLGSTWDTGMLLIELEPVGNDWLDGQEGQDILFGQLGDDELKGGAGADMLHGDNANVFAPFQPNSPLVRTGIRLIGSQANAGIELAEAGTVIASKALMDPSEGDALDGGIALVPEVVRGAFSGLVQEELVRSSGDSIMAYTSFVMDRLHHQSVLDGNDTLSGNDGNDLIFGDTLTTLVPSITPFPELDRSIDEVTAAVASVGQEMRYLSLDYASLHGLRQTSALPYEIKIASDQIDGGDDDDLIFADDTIWFVPNNFAQDHVFETDPLMVNEFLRDLERIVVDFGMYAFEAHVPVLHDLVSESVIKTPVDLPTGTVIHPDYHQLSYGNDDVLGGGGDDFIVGDNGTLVTAGITGIASSLSNPSVTSSADRMQFISEQLAAQSIARRDDLNQHVVDSHHDFRQQFPSSADLALIVHDFGIREQVNNDQLGGSANNDLIIGDEGVVAVATWDAARVTQPSQQELDGLLVEISDFLHEGHFRGVDIWEGHQSLNIQSNREFRDLKNFSVPLVAHQDVLKGGEDDDILLGDHYSIAMVIPDDLSSSPNPLSTNAFNFKHVASDFDGVDLTHKHTSRSREVLDDRLEGGPGNDLLLGMIGEDTLLGGSDDDRLFGGADIDIVDGGTGDNLVSQYDVSNSAPDLESRTQETLIEAFEPLVSDFLDALVTGASEIPLEVDFGDAPNPYAVLLADDGARHVIGDLRLGQLIDPDPNGLVASDAKGDGDDGMVVLADAFTHANHSLRSSFEVTVTAAGRLDAWLDFNGDGDWWDEGERIASSIELEAGRNVIEYVIPAGSFIGDTGARFRVSTVGGLDPIGLAVDGEVEDYLVPIQDSNAIFDAHIKAPGPTTNIDVDETKLSVKDAQKTLFESPLIYNRVNIFGSSIDDTFSFEFSSLQDASFTIDGGEGKNTAQIGGPELQMKDIAEGSLVNIHRLDTTGAGATQILVDATSLASLSPVTRTLTISIGAEDDVDFNSAERWNLVDSRVIDGEFAHIIGTQEGDEQVNLLRPQPWQQPLSEFDINNSGVVTAGDALRIINELNQRNYSDSMTGNLVDPVTLKSWPGVYFDSNGDDRVSALDALRVINHLSRQPLSGGGLGEGEMAPLHDDRLPSANPSNLLSKSDFIQNLDAALLEQEWETSENQFNDDQLGFVVDQISGDPKNDAGMDSERVDSALGEERDWEDLDDSLLDPND